MNAVDHNNVVIFDDRGIPSIMCRFVRPKDTEEIPAVFKIGDKVADAIYISKYPNTVIDGRAYSMPMADPTVNITFDEAVQACRCKGLGWHLMTAVEYEYLLNQSIFDSDAAEARRQMLSGDHAQGIYQKLLVVRIRLSDLEKEPRQDLPFFRTSGGRYVKDGCHRGFRRRFAVRISK